MEPSQYRIGRNRRPAIRVTRDEIAVALDGSAPDDEIQAGAAYRAAIGPLATVMDRPLQRLRRLSEAGLVAASARFDDTHRLLGALEIPLISTCAISEAGSWPGVVVIGCLGQNDAQHSRWLERMLARGAIVVSSDRSAAMPVIASGLNVATVQPRRRARAAVYPGLADRLESGGNWGRLVGQMNPAVRLSAGHLPLVREQYPNAKVIADDALAGEPLVVLAPVGGGQVLHSVAHWWQEAPPDLTELGQRPLAAVPPFANLGRSHPVARFGWFSAASVMLASLLAGLDAALDHAAWHVEGARNLMSLEDA
jgi:6,7-dimethyl-8-ribityllumazine synthase